MPRHTTLPSELWLTILKAKNNLIKERNQNVVKNQENSQCRELHLCTVFLPIALSVLSWAERYPLYGKVKNQIEMIKYNYTVYIKRSCSVPTSNI